MTTPKTLTYLIFSILMLISGFSYSQKSTRYIFVEIQGLTVDRGFPDVRQSLSVLPERITIQYCQQLGLAILQVNNGAEHTEKNISKILSKNNYRFYIKKPVPIESLITPCHLN